LEQSEQLVSLGFLEEYFWTTQD